MAASSRFSLARAVLLNDSLTVDFDILPGLLTEASSQTIFIQLQSLFITSNPALPYGRALIGWTAVCPDGSTSVNCAILPDSIELASQTSVANDAVLAGIIVGILGGILVIGGLCFLHRRREAQKKNAGESGRLVALRPSV
jgi:hypothetical protein